MTACLGGEGVRVKEHSRGPLFQSGLPLGFAYACVCTGDKDLWEGRNKQLGVERVEVGSFFGGSLGHLLINNFTLQWYC